MHVIHKKNQSTLVYFILNYIQKFTDLSCALIENIFTYTACAFRVLKLLNMKHSIPPFHGDFKDNFVNITCSLPSAVLALFNVICENDCKFFKKLKYFLKYNR